MTLEGYLHDATGTPVPSGTVEIWEAVTGTPVGGALYTTSVSTGRWAQDVDDTKIYDIKITVGAQVAWIKGLTKAIISQLKVGTLIAAGATINGNLTITGTVDGVDVSAHAAGADAHHAKSHAHDGVDGSGAVAHSATTGRTENDHHNKIHNHTSAAEGGTINMSKETFVPIPDAGIGDTESGYKLGELDWTYVASRYPGLSAVIADFYLWGDNPSGGLWDITAGAWVGGEQIGAYTRKTLTVSLVDGHKYAWRVTRTGSGAAACRGFIILRIS